MRILDLTTQQSHSAVRWRARGTFAGPGSFMGFAPNGASIDLEGCDVVTVTDELITHNDAYLDSGDLARQLGLLPPAGSASDARLTRLANLRTRMREAVHGVDVESIADGVWVVRRGFPMRTMNVYLIEDEGGVTVFDAAAPALAAPTLLGRLLPAWDGGAVPIAGTVAEGDEIAGFRVVELPGHAPGLIGLYREADRLALVSDCFYTLDPQTGRKGDPRVPHPAFDADVEQARASIRKLAAMEPSAAWAGHADPVTGDVRAQLERAAVATL